MRAGRSKRKKKECELNQSSRFGGHTHCALLSLPRRPLPPRARVYPLWWSLRIGLQQRPPSARAPPRRRGLLPSPTFLFAGTLPRAAPPPRFSSLWGRRGGGPDQSRLRERERARRQRPPLGPPLSHTHAHTRDAAPQARRRGVAALHPVQGRARREEVHVQRCEGGGGGGERGKARLPTFLDDCSPSLPPTLPSQRRRHDAGRGIRGAICEWMEREGRRGLVVGGWAVIFFDQTTPPHFLPPPAKKKTFRSPKYWRSRPPKTRASGSPRTRS